jgi:hypothetical protein
LIQFNSIEILMKTIVFNSIDFNLKFWIQFKFNYVTFNSNFMMQIHSILNHWNGTWFFHKIHSSFSSIHHQSWCTSTWSPSCIIGKNYVEISKNRVKIQRTKFCERKWKNNHKYFIYQQRKFGIFKFNQLFYLIDYWIDMWLICWNLKPTGP